MKRRKAVLTAALALLVALAAFGTAAFFSGEAHVTNVITTGKIDITLNEYTKAGDQLVAWPGDGITGVMPGQSVDKLVSVKNEGTGEAWVRVKVASTITAADGKETLPTSGMLDFDFQDGWIADEDGYYYYYSKPLKPEETTPQLFTKVTFAPGMPNEYQGCTVNVDVFAQAVQVKNNTGAGETPITELTASNYTQIAGWPEE